MRRKARTDANHAEIRKRLREIGWFVFDSSRVGAGFPDLVCIRGGQVVFVEVKDGAKKPSARKLTPAEEVLHRQLKAAGAYVAVIERAEDLR